EGSPDIGDWTAGSFAVLVASVVGYFLLVLSLRKIRHLPSPNLTGIFVVFVLVYYAAIAAFAALAQTDVEAPLVALQFVLSVVFLGGWVWAANHTHYQHFYI